ncbi:hypothetical protein DQ04_00711130 [Trypanosoma grayi]|uniref:hypothetical protein n=1 Tax=Trypanosoma grayi TaxID=71804 RepID=UPI0004F4B34F|nr:hypothetical protein DQ04_00711130 [Trypanosoma grayi]KEG13935.1 hypothetical protein DQ04_00711130 [Trypanosoma grayi]
MKVALLWCCSSRIASCAVGYTTLSPSVDAEDHGVVLREEDAAVSNRSWTTIHQLGAKQKKIFGSVPLRPANGESDSSHISRVKIQNISAGYFQEVADIAVAHEPTQPTSASTVLKTLSERHIRPQREQPPLRRSHCAND